MANLLVGTIGAVTVGTSGAAVTPAFGAGENRLAKNLLVCFVTSQGSATLPTTPSGWSIASQKAGTTCSETVYYKIAAGGDSAPTIALITGSVLSVNVGEFSGSWQVVPADQSGNASGTTSPITGTCAAVDGSIGELVIMAAGAHYSVAATKTLTPTSNNATFTTQNNSATSTVNHYSHSYALSSTSKAAATTGVLTYTTTSITGAAVAIATFRLAGAINHIGHTDAPAGGTFNYTVIASGSFLSIGVNTFPGVTGLSLTVNGVSWQKQSEGTGPGTTFGMSIFEGVTNGTGVQSIVISGIGASAIDVTVDEFGAGIPGVWSIIAGTGSNGLTNASASAVITFANLIATASGQAYWGFTATDGLPAGTGTAGFTFGLTANNDAYIYNTNLSAGAITPTENQSSGNYITGSVIFAFGPVPSHLRHSFVPQIRASSW